MDDFDKQIEQLHHKAQRNRHDFLLAATELVVSAIEFGTTELKLGNAEVARTEAANASRGIETVARFLPDTLASRRAGGFIRRDHLSASRLPGANSDTSSI